MESKVKECAFCCRYLNSKGEWVVITDSFKLDYIFSNVEREFVTCPDCQKKEVVVHAESG